MKTIASVFLLIVSLAIFVYSLTSACGRLGYGGLTTFCAIKLDPDTRHESPGLFSSPSGRTQP
jgi:hypothetical protein